METTTNIQKPVEPKVQDAFVEPQVLEVGDEELKMEPRYLKNVGKPTLKKVYLAKRNGWIDESGKKYHLMVVLPYNRTGDKKWTESDMVDAEARMAREIGLTGEQKGYVYFDPDFGSKIETKGWERVKKVKIVPMNHNFVAQDFPHIKDYTCGLGGAAGSRSYTVMVGQIIKVSDANDFEHLWNNLTHLDEVTENGKLIKENVYSQKQAKPDEPVETKGRTEKLPTEENSPKIVSPNKDVDQLDVKLNEAVKKEDLL